MKLAARMALTSEAPCVCGRKVWRDMTLTVGLSVEHRYCEKCRQEVLVIRRRAVWLKTLPYRGRAAQSVAIALRTYVHHHVTLAGRAPPLSEAEVSEIIQVAKELEELLPHTEPCRTDPFESAAPPAAQPSRARATARRVLKRRPGGATSG